MIDLETEMRLVEIREVLDSTAVDPHELATSYVYYVDAVKAFGGFPDSFRDFVSSRYGKV
jgi:hypothetical protein